MVKAHNSLKDSTSKMEINHYADMDVSEMPLMKNLPLIEDKLEYDHPLLSVPTEIDWRT